MSARQPSKTRSPRVSPDRRRRPDGKSAVRNAIRRGFVVGGEVLVGTVPGVIVGYNIGEFGRFVGTLYPLVVRTALGLAKCSPEELELI